MNEKTKSLQYKKVKKAMPRGSKGPSFGNEPGLLAAIQRLRAAEIAAAEDYRLALTTGDADLGARKKRDWLDLIEQLRRVEVSNPDVQKANLSTLPADEVEQETARMVNAFRLALESIPRSLPQKLAGADEVQIQEILAGAVNEALAQLHSNKWRTL